MYNHFHGDFCPFCEDAKDEKESITEFFSGVLDYLYGDFPKDDAEHCVENLCAYLDLHYPKEEMKSKKLNPYFQLGAALARSQAIVLNRNKLPEGE